ncbi:hypothetical protein [Ruminococcus sp. HUN007]|uniref:hypothetical protein n=1 Tax=Ruminococcus sp. HUN007 TaxID=1514668 RepID=UPI000B1E1AD0|nr:hypothetical protein [Ruminococcus sp. HUN007]
MKVHTEPKRKTDYSFHRNDSKKMKKKVLERCLKSLQPLMNAIPCELIVADTGFNRFYS